MDINKLTFGEIKELMQLFSGSTKQSITETASPHIGKRVVVRSYGSGVHFGTLKAKENNQAGVEVELADSRRIHYWDGAASLSQLAMEGVSKASNCRMPCKVDTMTVTQVLEIIPTTDKAGKSLDAVAIWQK